MIKCNKLICIISNVITRYCAIIISIFQSLNVHTTTNEFVSDYQKQLNSIVATYESQWDVLTKNADKITAAISAGEEKQKLLDKLMKRIENKNDPLLTLIYKFMLIRHV